MDANGFLEISLVEKGLIDAEKIDKLRQLISEELPLPDMLVEQKAVDEDTVLDVMSEYFGIPTVNLNHYAPEDEVLAIVPIFLCQRYDIFPLFKIKNTLMIATANPSDVHAMDEIRVKTGFGIEPILALRKSVKSAISSFYSVGDSVTNVIENIDTDETDSDIALHESELIDEAGDEPIVKLVNLFISQAIRDRASDIHINPEEKTIRIRYRIDGILHEIAQPPKKFQAAMLSRIKILASLDIAERRLPQDGRINLKVDGRPIDLRVSTLPTIYGENIVMRVLDKGSVLVGMNELGMSERDLTVFWKALKKPNGIILTSGPTGSGKTTTLYAALQGINNVDTNIITLEDPVEYNLELVRQAQVNTKIGYTFASGLRAILRQDPDVVLVGEIRDQETASIAVQAAMTGHLVLSTLHTNDAPGCILRLTEMGIQHFLVAATLATAIAQRLVRVICPSCKETYTPEREILEELNLTPESMTFYRGAGCQDCRNTGYKGRLGLYEVMSVTQRVQEAIVHKVAELELRKIAREEGMTTLAEDGIEKMRQGLTTIDEVVRVTKLN